MINITTKKLEIESELKKKIEFICDFCNTKPTIINGILGGNATRKKNGNISIITINAMIAKFQSKTLTLKKNLRILLMKFKNMIQ